MLLDGTFTSMMPPEASRGGHFVYENLTAERALLEDETDLRDKICVHVVERLCVVRHALSRLPAVTYVVHQALTQR